MTEAERALAGTHIRALVQHMQGDAYGTMLLTRALECMDITLAGLVPPGYLPNQAKLEKAPEAIQGPSFFVPASDRVRPA